MNKIITHLDAHKVLDDVKPEHEFKTKDGVNVRNLHQLEATLNDMSDKTFDHHVDEDKNDFKNWINNILGDEELANSLSNCKTKQQMIAEMRSRIHRLHKIRHRGVCPYDKHIAHGAGSFSMGLIVGLLAGIMIALM